MCILSLLYLSCVKAVSVLLLPLAETRSLDCSSTDIVQVLVGEGEEPGLPGCLEVRLGELSPRWGCLVGAGFEAYNSPCYRGIIVITRLITTVTIKRRHKEIIHDIQM